jgi:uncharacterized membrane protein YfcA
LTRHQQSDQLRRLKAQVTPPVIVYTLLGLLVLAAIILLAAWVSRYTKTKEPSLPSPVAILIGAVTNFFDTLGIGSFAPTTAAIKFLKLTPDENIPGTLNVGHALPTIAQALIFITIVKVDVMLLLALISVSVLGALIGARIVTRLPRKAIQAGMGVALIIAAALYAAKNLGYMDQAEGAALALQGPAFAGAAALFFLFGALMTLGIGLYAPALITLSLFGMDPRAAFPIMMGACAFLMPAASLNFIRSGRLAPKVAAGLALGGVPAVLVAAYIVKELPLDALRWLVAAVVLIVGVTMLMSAAKSAPQRAPA